LKDIKHFDIKNPLSGATGEVNGATYMLMQREDDIEQVIKRMIDMYFEGYDLNNDDIQEYIFKQYNIYPLVLSETLYIQKKVSEGINAKLRNHR
jgi:hypothetical protein